MKINYQAIKLFSTIASKSFHKTSVKTSQKHLNLTVNELLYEVYQDEDELDNYKKILKFEKEELYNMDLLNLDQKLHIDFQFGPNSKIFTAKQLMLVNKFGKIYEPINLLNTTFVSLLSQRYKIIKNPRKEFVRNLTRLEYLGKFIFKEISYKLMLPDFERSQGNFIRLTKLVNKKIVYNDNINMDLYFQLDAEKINLPENRVITTRIGGNNRLKRIQPFYIFLGLKYLEDSESFELLMKNILIDLKVSNFIYFLKKEQYLIKEENYNKMILNNINRKLKKLIATDITLNQDIFSSIIRPKLLPYKSTRLPSLPRLVQPKKTNLLLKLALLNPYSTIIKNEANILPLKRMSESLDAFGDIILKRTSFEFFNSILLKDVNHLSIFTDHLFLNSNFMFGRLAEIYKLDKGIDSIVHQSETIDYMKQDILINESKTIYELFGDIFERYIAVLYLDSPDNCQKWLFKLFELIYETLVIDKFDGKILDREYFQHNVLKESFKYLK